MDHPSVEGVQFKAIPDYPGYRAGDDGSIWVREAFNVSMGSGPERWRQVVPTPVKYGYLKLQVRGPSGRKLRFVHRLVLEAFVGPRPRGMVCRHFPDRNPSNNRLDNLQWGTCRENAADKKVHGTTTPGSKNPSAKLSEADAIEVRRLAYQGKTFVEIGAKFGITSGAAGDILRGKTWKHLGIADPPGTLHYPRKVTAAIAVEMQRLRDAGWLLREIAAKFNVAASYPGRFTENPKKRGCGAPLRIAR